MTTPMQAVVQIKRQARRAVWHQPTLRVDKELLAMLLEDHTRLQRENAELRALLQPKK